MVKFRLEPFRISLDLRFKLFIFQFKYLFLLNRKVFNRFKIKINLFDEYLSSLCGNFLQEIKINYLFFRKIRTVFNQIQVEIVNCLEVFLKGLKFIHFHLLLYHREIFNYVILQIID
jgi:hypothetical protein